MFLISLFFGFFLNKKPNSISYLCYFLVKLHSLYSMPLKYFYTKIFSHVEQTYIKEVMVIYRMKIDTGQNRETYQETNSSKQRSHDRAQMQKGNIQEGKQGQAAKEECKNIAWACRDGVSKAKTQIELELPRGVTGHNVSSNKVSWSSLPRTMCSQILNIYANGDLANSLGNPI